MTTQIIKDQTETPVKKTAATLTDPSQVGTPPPAPANPIEITDADFKSAWAGHARIVKRYQSEAGYRHRTHVRYYNAARSEVLRLRDNRLEREAGHDATRERVAAMPRKVRPCQQPHWGAVINGVQRLIIRKPEILDDIFAPIFLSRGVVRNGGETVSVGLMFQYEDPDTSEVWSPVLRIKTIAIGETDDSNLVEVEIADKGE